MEEMTSTKYFNISLWISEIKLNKTEQAIQLWNITCFKPAISVLLSSLDPGQDLKLHMNIAWITPSHSNLLWRLFLVRQSVFFRADGNDSPLLCPMKSSLEINPKDCFPLERKGPYLEKPLQYSSGSIW